MAGGVLPEGGGSVHDWGTRTAEGGAYMAGQHA